MTIVVIRPLFSRDFGSSPMGYANNRPPMTVRVKKSFPTANTIEAYKQPGVFFGDRYYTHKDGPFEVPAERADAMLKAGLVDAVARMAVTEAERRAG